MALSVSLLPLSLSALRSRRSGVLGSTPRRSRPAASHSPLWKLLSGHFVFQRSSWGSEFLSGPCFWSRLCGLPTTSLGVLCHLRRSLGAGCPGDPADLDARGWAEGAPDPESLPRAESQLRQVRAVGFETTAAYFINRLGVRVSIGVFRMGYDKHLGQCLARGKLSVDVAVTGTVIPGVLGRSLCE